MTVKLKGKPVTKEIYANIIKEIDEYSLLPKLIIMIIGNDPAARYYVQNLEKRGRKAGINIQTIDFPEEVVQDQIIDEIKKCNEDNNIHGIMIQKPLPKHINESEITLTIDPQKDMDAFHPVNIGNMVLDQKSFIPSTTAAVLEMIKYYQIKTTGKHVVVLGRSNIIGKPIANLLLRKNETGNATVTICHSRTRNLHSITQQADILIAAIGQPLFVKKDMIHDNVIILDVGVNQVEDAEKNQDPSAFYLALRDFTWAFNDGHVGLGGGEIAQQLFMDDVSGGYGFAIRELDDGYDAVLMIPGFSRLVGGKGQGLLRSPRCQGNLAQLWKPEPYNPGDHCRHGGRGRVNRSSPSRRLRERRKDKGGCPGADRYETGHELSSQDRCEY